MTLLNTKTAKDPACPHQGQMHAVLPGPACGRPPFGTTTPSPGQGWTPSMGRGRDMASETKHQQRIRLGGQKQLPTEDELLLGQQGVHSPQNCGWNWDEHKGSFWLSDSRPRISDSGGMGWALPRAPATGGRGSPGPAPKLACKSCLQQGTSFLLIL